LLVIGKNQVGGLVERSLAALSAEDFVQRYLLDALQARSGLAIASLQAELLDLELAGQLERLPGGLFQRLVKG
jgi:predicted Rossmann fold nucleotide-binding protein DprA/Smf involved in DNA uptake